MSFVVYRARKINLCADCFHIFGYITAVLYNVFCLGPLNSLYYFLNPFSNPLQMP
jgi:hypothetical protein